LGRGLALIEAPSVRQVVFLFVLLGCGSGTVNVVPLVSLLSNVTVPLSASVMRLTTDKPKPSFRLRCKQWREQLGFYVFGDAYAIVFDGQDYVICFFVSVYC